MTEASSDPRSAEDGGAAVARTRQFVTFLIGTEAFAVDMAPVQEIIRVPEVVRVPLAPGSLEGLANLRGRVLPIVSLRRVFGFDPKAADDATRAVVIDLGQPLGFIVDRVTSVIDVEPDRIEGVEATRATVKSELLSGILKDVGGYPMVMVLDFAKLIATEFASIAAASKQAGDAVSVKDARDAGEPVHGDELQLVSFTVAEQEYAIDIASVHEIVQVPASIIHVPKASEDVLGLMTLRERLLPLVSLRRLFGLPARDLDDRSRIVVVALGAAAVGVVTDSVSEVLRVPSGLVEGMPELLARNRELADITRICRLEDGKRLVSILAVENMFRHAMVKAALQEATRMSEGTPVTDDDERGNEEDEQVVVFRLADGEFGVPIECVQEIVRVPEVLTRVPKAPPFVEGMINLRGMVLPVVDQRKRLGLAHLERNDRQRIMVFLLGGLRMGFIVDAVIEVLKVPKTLIEAAPPLSGEQARILGRVANLERQKRIIQFLDPAHLIDTREQESLSAVAA